MSSDVFFLVLRARNFLKLRLEVVFLYKSLYILHYSVVMEAVKSSEILIYSVKICAG